MREILYSEEDARAWIRQEIDPTARQWAQLDKFAELLVDENQRQNLISASTIPNLWVRHIADSAQLLKMATVDFDHWIDLGSGAGLPGLVIAILSERPITLVESRKLRCNFMRNVAAQLNLSHVNIAEARLEQIKTFKAAVISARAFAPLEKLIHLSNRFAADDSCWLLPKGRNAVIELASLPNAWQNMFHVEQSLTDAESRILVGRGQLPQHKREEA